MGQHKHKQAPSHSEQLMDAQALILYNDKVNTFDYVIESLMEVCDHTPEQAEQSAMIAHFKGKCSVLEGEYSKLKAAQEGMSRREITVSIE